MNVDGEVIDGVLITALGTDLDGIGEVFGLSGPVTLRPDSQLPATGVMECDIADLEILEAEGTLFNFLIHEMGHVLGIGNLWEEMGLIEGAGTEDPCICWCSCYA